MKSSEEDNLTERIKKYKEECPIYEILITKYFNNYLINKYGTSNLDDKKFSDNEIEKLMGWVLAIKDYEVDIISEGVYKALKEAFGKKE